MTAPFMYRLYVGATMLLVPFAARSQINKLRRAGVSVPRAHEKLGHATQERRGAGPMVWFHGASVGESMAALSLVERMGELLPRAHFLMTSGTATSAEMVARRLPPRTVHQFAPLDAPGPIGRFLTHWRPDAAVFVESELWPQMLRRTYANGARLALVNARLSERSVNRWSKRPALARYVLEVFSLILTQNAQMAEAMHRMQAPEGSVKEGVNLKSLSAPLPVDHDLLTTLRTQIGSRPVWVASSTHRGEEEIILAAHKALVARWPDLLLILAPRHPERGGEIAALIQDAGLSLHHRSKGDAPGGQVYLADTLGELGLWYALSPLVFLGGSLLPIGGHNPYEVAQAGAAVVSGTHVANFAETFTALQSAKAVEMVDKDSLQNRVESLLANPTDLQALQDRGSQFANARATTLDKLVDQLITALELRP